MSIHRQPLPIDGALPDVLRTVAENPVTILTAAPGAGKTTRVPLALLDSAIAPRGRILMLEPRRLAAQRAADYMASLMGEAAGQSVGYRMRGMTRVSGSTRVEVVTEGILTRMLQDAPDLPGVGVLVFDEFHERSIHADLGLALSLDVQAHLRPDLRILIMSATLDGVGLQRLFPQVPIVDSPGRQHPVETIYAAFVRTGPSEKSVALAIRRALQETEGDILVFLPGRPELRRVRDTLLDARLPPGTHVHLLHGEAAPEVQTAALAPGGIGSRKVILSTSVAETSVTIDGVRVVIDSGLARVPRFDPRRGMTGLETVTVSAATADQRRGRAGRQAPGVCYRLWTESEQQKLDRYPVPEILAADLAPLALELARWGAPDASGLRLIDPPPTHNLAQARTLLRELGALGQDGRIAPHGLAMAGLPIHPRLAHMVITAAGRGLGPAACTVAALLEGPPLTTAGPAADVDLAGALQALEDQRTSDRAARFRIRADADRLRRLMNLDAAPPAARDCGYLLALAYPDRIARRRGDAGNRYLLTNGTGTRLPEWSLLSRSEFLAVGEVDNADVEARIRVAAPLTLDEIRQAAAGRIQSADEVHWDAREEAVVARRVTRLGAVALTEVPLPSAGDAVVTAMIEGVRELGLDALPWRTGAMALRMRCEWLRRNFFEGGDWPDMSDGALLHSIDRWLAPFLQGMTRKEHLQSLDLSTILLSLLTASQRTVLDRLAPASLPTPAGGRVALQYGEERQPVMAVRLQEMFGQTESPSVGGGTIPVVLHLLSPAGRPLAVTSDLRSFWANAHIEVRKHMRGRYPKHRWPEHPLDAAPGPSRKKR